MLIDYTYFEQDPTYIAGIDVKSGCTPTGAAQEIVRNVESCIRRYEPKFLREAKDQLTIWSVTSTVAWAVGVVEVLILNIFM